MNVDFEAILAEEGKGMERAIAQGKAGILGQHGHHRIEPRFFRQENVEVAHGPFAQIAIVAPAETRSLEQQRWHALARQSPHDAKAAMNQQLVEIKSPA